MPDQRFDASSSITFDLAHGLVRLDGAPDRVLVPAGALAALCAAAGAEALAAFGRSMGEDLGRRAASRLGDAHAEATSGVRAASIEAVVDHLGGELALAGLGTLGVERWGKALVMVVDHAPAGERGDALIAALLEGAMQEATGRAACVRLLGRDGARARFFVSGSGAAEKVTAWIAGGASWGEALMRLHSPPAGSAQPGEGSAVGGNS